MVATHRGVPSVQDLIHQELGLNGVPGQVMRVVFEEIIDLRYGHLLGYEVLTRVDAHPSMHISPETWFSGARSIGLEARIEARAIELALSRLPDDETMISVNISPDCLDSPEIQAILDRLAALDRVAVVELSEHHHVDTRRLAYGLASIRDRQMLVAVDDAGTGDSGPEFVREVQPDIIKIDRTHVSQLHRNPSQRGFIHRFAEIADEQRSVLVTEGVSSPRVVEAINRLGDKWGLDFLGQGYWLTNNRPRLAM